eukprot:1847898-Rhodomonas_salina.1
MTIQERWEGCDGDGGSGCGNRSGDGPRRHHGSQAAAIDRSGPYILVSTRGNRASAISAAVHPSVSTSGNGVCARCGGINRSVSNAGDGGGTKAVLIRDSMIRGSQVVEPACCGVVGGEIHRRRAFGITAGDRQTGPVHACCNMQCARVPAVIGGER